MIPNTLELCDWCQLNGTVGLHEMHTNRRLQESWSWRPKLTPYSVQYVLRLPSAKRETKEVGGLIDSQTDRLIDIILVLFEKLK